MLAAAYGASLPRVAERSWSWLSAPGSGLSVALLLLVAKRQGLSRKTLEGWHKASQGTGPGRADAQRRIAALRQDAEVALARASHGYRAADDTAQTVERRLRT